MASPAAPKLTFALNGELIQLSEVDPSTTLNEFIRTKTRFKGTKFVCGEGGCGACVVSVSRYDPKQKVVNESSINSCLALLCSLDGLAITTTEGIGSSKSPNGFHSVQKRMAGFHASQCGFCTPGMTMAIYSALRKSAKSSNPDSMDSPPTCQHSPEMNGSNGCPEANGVAGTKVTTLPNLSVSQAESAICGNICRCTGYRPILDVCRSFSGDLDIEDLSTLGINTFGRNGSNHVQEFDQLPSYDISKDPTFPPQLIQLLEEREQENSGLAIDWKTSDQLASRRWRTVNSLDSLFSLLEELKDDEIKLVVGNTSAGIYKNDNPKVYIDIQNVPELNSVLSTSQGLTVGTSIRINRLIELLEGSEANSHSTNGHITNGDHSRVHGQVFPALAYHLKRLAGQHVRNAASIGGNLIMAQTRGFESDLATILLGAGAILTAISLKKGKRQLSVDEFLSMKKLDQGEILTSLFIPSFSSPFTYNPSDSSNGVPSQSSIDLGVSVDERDKIVFKTYRAAVRPLGNAHAFVNSAFLICLKESLDDTDPNRYSVKYARLAFGAFGCHHAVRATSAENYLIGKPITLHTLSEVIRLTKSEIIPLKGTKKSEYRSSLIVSFLFSFFSNYVPSVLPQAIDSSLLPSNVIETNGINLSNGTFDPIHENQELDTKRKRIKGRGTQNFEFPKDHFPVSEPIKKVGAEYQASGEAVYVDDIPTPPRCAFAAIVGSRVACGKIVSVDYSEALLQPGVIGYFDIRKDSPAFGKNIGFESFERFFPLFAEEEVEFIGHPIALMVADSYKHAKAAAEKVKVEYDLSQSEPIFTIEDAEKRNSYYPLLSFFANFIPKAGNFEEEFSKSEFKIDSEVFLNSQQHFYLEQQSAMAVPDEQNSITVYASAQNPENIQKVVSACLNAPRNSVRVITRRLGGGFGGKATRSSQIAAACALAAKKFDRPVKMCLDLNTDMELIGGRHHTRARYSIGFDANGKFNALKVVARLNGGYSIDASSWIPMVFSNSLVQYAWGALSLDVKACKTNLSSKTAVRGPGEVQGCYVAETIIEHVASFLNLPPTVVRERNMLTPQYLNQVFPNVIGDDPTDFTFPRVWNELKENAKFDQRKKFATEFNEKNRWKKRGLSMVPCTYKVTVIPRPSRVSVFFDGSVVIEQGGVEMGQGLITKVQQAAVYSLNKLWAAETIEENGQPNESKEEKNSTSSKLNLSLVRIVDQDSISLPFGGMTAGSTTSESSCESVSLACAILVDRLRPVKEQLEKSKGQEVTWMDIVKKAHESRLELSTQLFPKVMLVSYCNFGAAISEVEIDVLTGQTTILQSDLVYDCGKSLNPAVDIGQIEGSFIQGVGFFTTEEVVVDENGRLISNGTWEYKPPTFDTIPKILNVNLLHSAPNKKGFLSSKASGEPPLLLATSIPCAIREAILAVKSDQTKTNSAESQSPDSFLRLDTPVSMDKVKQFCGFNLVEDYLTSLIPKDSKV